MKEEIRIPDFDKINPKEYSEEFLKYYIGQNNNIFGKNPDGIDTSKLYYREGLKNPKLVVYPGGGIGVMEDDSTEEETNESGIYDDFKKQIEENIKEQSEDSKQREKFAECVENSGDAKLEDPGLSQTEQDYTSCINQCRDVFLDKLNVFGPSWRILHPESITDQIYIRISKVINMFDNNKSLELSEIISEIKAIVNYCFIYLIQHRVGRSSVKDISNDDAVRMFDEVLQHAYDFMVFKNSTQYNESWRMMRFYSYLDFILMKIMRVREIENSSRTHTECKENYYYDIINYAIFALIRLS